VNKPNKPDKGHLRSVWFRLPPRFYQRVGKVAEECALEPEDVISRGVTLVLLEHRKKKSDVTARSRAAATLVSGRWASTTPAERRELAKNLANRRWALKKKAEGDE
jgi:hypothetical protein